MHMLTKKYLRKKANKLCLMGQIVIESHSFLEYCRTVKSTCRLCLECLLKLRLRFDLLTRNKFSFVIRYILKKTDDI